MVIPSGRSRPEGQNPAYRPSDPFVSRQLPTCGRRCQGRFVLIGTGPLPLPVRGTRASRARGSIIGVAGRGSGLAPSSSEAKTL